MRVWGSASGTAGRRPRELGLRDEHRQGADHQHQDRPGRELHQQHPEARQRDGVLGQAEGLVDQAQRARRGLAAGAGQLVVELGVLELRERQGAGLLEDHHVDLLAEQGAQQRLLGGQAALGQGDGGDHPGLRQHVAQHSPPLDAAGLAMQRHRRDHGVDDQLADPGRHRRQHAGDQGAEREPQGQRPRGLPDQRQGAMAVAKDAEEAGEHAARARRGGGGCMR